MGFENSDRLARLHQQGFVVLKRFECTHDGVVAIPISRRFPRPAIDNQVLGTLPDFFRQRIRIEMGKVQLARQYPELAARGAPQPRARAALGSLGPGGLARLAAYLGLRSAAHAVAWWRYRRGATAGIWRQAATTKRWDLV